MILNRLSAATAVWFLLAASVQAQNESLASIFTNANNGNTRPMVVPRRSSIILIACHGLGFGDLSCYGQTNFQTPNIDRLAAEGTRFTDYRAASDDLGEALGVLSTGSGNGLSGGTLTLAARLTAAGYRTKLVGEWPLGQPWMQGYGEFAGYLDETDARNFYSDYIYRYAPSAIHDITNRTTTPFNGREELYPNTLPEKGDYIPDVLMGVLVNFSRISRPLPVNHYQPFYIQVDLQAPASVTPGKDDYPVPTDAPYSGEAWPQAARNRAAMITRLDSDVGRLFEQLGKMGMTNNVAIFLTASVPAEKFADTNLDFLMVKGEVRGGESPDRFKVPMIVRWPGHVPAGKVSSIPWSAVDFAPTAMEIGYARPEAKMDGMSVFTMLRGEPGTNTPMVPDRTTY